MRQNKSFLHTDDATILAGFQNINGHDKTKIAAAATCSMKKGSGSTRNGPVAYGAAHPLLLCACLVSVMLIAVVADAHRIHVRQEVKENQKKREEAEIAPKIEGRRASAELDDNEEQEQKFLLEEAEAANVDAEGKEQGAMEKPKQQQQQQQQTMMAFDPQKCSIYGNEPLHALMDRICELCHDMYSHQHPNMRAECRSDCFRSINFKRCLRLFRPMASPISRSRSLRHMVDAMDALAEF